MIYLLLYLLFLIIFQYKQYNQYADEVEKFYEKQKILKQFRRGLKYSHSRE